MLKKFSSKLPINFVVSRLFIGITIGVYCRIYVLNATDLKLQNLPFIATGEQQNQQ